MPEVEIKIRFIGSKDKLPSQKLRWLIDMFDILGRKGEKIPEMEISTTDQYGFTFQTKVQGSELSRSVLLASK